MSQRYTILILLVLALIAIGAGLALRGGNSTSISVPIQAEFEEKIVYTTSMDIDKEPLRAHCEAQGGTFNECGSQCAPDVDFCTAVCALTCENLASQ